MAGGFLGIDGRGETCNALSDIGYQTATHCQNIRPKMTNCGFHATSHNGYQFPRKAHEYCKSREFRLSAISALLSVFPNFDMYPFTERGFDGIAWNTPWFLALNYVTLGMVGLWLAFSRRRPYGQ